MAQSLADPLVAAEERPVDFAPLSDDAVAKQTDSGSFSRGKTYFRGKRIFNAVRRGNTIRARCRGSSGGPYRVEATLATADQKKQRNPVSYACDCPRGGFCKHVVALLLTWIDKPEAFEVRPPIGELLAGKSQEELVALIEAMVAKDPDLEPLLELPPPAALKPGDAPVDEAAIRRLIAAAMNSGRDYDNDGYGYGNGYGSRDRYDYYDDYDNSSRVASELEPVITLAEGYAEGGHWRNGLLVAATLVEELTPALDDYADDNGDLSTLLLRSGATLAACLAAQEQLPPEQRLNDDERARLIDAVLAIWNADVEGDGLDESESPPEVIGKYATQAERTHVRDRLRATLVPPTGDSWTHQSHNRGVIWFLSLLKGEGGLSDEELLDEYRNAELWEDAAYLLLEKERVEEAIGLAARKIDAAGQLTAFADRVLASNDPSWVQRAIALVDDRLWEREGKRLQDDQTLREWLERRYREHGQPEKALALAESRFKTAPSKATYDAVKSAALAIDQSRNSWAELRPKLLAALAKGKSWYVLIEIHLDEGNIPEALAALTKSEKPTRTGQGLWGDYFMASPESYSARVAKAAEKEFPTEAIRIYQKLAEQKIAMRNRGSYQEAASYLVLVMRLLEGNGREAEWKGFITDLRTQNKSLRALREELDSLGLV
jgi:uncharacterized Zn finger protein